MFRFALIAACTLAAVASAAAQSAQTAPKVGPIASSATGPWEAVVWGVGRKVHYCTMVRTGVPAGQPSYGLLIDQRGTVLSIETGAWTLTNAPTETVVKTSSGAERKFTAKPVSTRRGNIDLPKDSDLLDQLQRSEHAEVTMQGVTVRLAFDDFNAARVVLELCVQHIGKDMPETR
jgi:hypothetical protein